MKNDWVKVEDQEPPKDGKPFLCYDPKQEDNFPDAKIYVVKWEEETKYSSSGYIECGGECYFKWDPTHWMPLPEVPK